MANVAYLSPVYIGGIILFDVIKILSRIGLVSFSQQFDYTTLSSYPYNMSYIFSSKQLVKSQTNQFSNILYHYILRSASIIVFLSLYSSNSHVFNWTQLLNLAASQGRPLSLAIITLSLIDYTRQSCTVRAWITGLVTCSTTRQSSTSMIQSQTLSLGGLKVDSAFTRGRSRVIVRYWL